MDSALSDAIGSIEMDSSFEQQVDVGLADLIIDLETRAKTLQGAARSAFEKRIASLKATFSTLTLNDLRNRSSALQGRMKGRGQHALASARSSVRTSVRKAMTGRGDASIREHLRTPDGIRLKDKLSYTIGVFGLLVTEAVILYTPALFWVWYTILIIPLIILRYIVYHSQSYQYFLLDFCYFCQGVCYPAAWSRSTSPWVLAAVFGITNGPMLWAMVAWRNALVFHSMEKVTSVYIHAFPVVLGYCWRWHGAAPGDGWGVTNEAAAAAKWGFWEAGGFAGLYLVPLLIYVLWQVLYFVKTEIYDDLDSKPHIVTSLRYMVKDTRNPLIMSVIRLLRRLGILKDAELDTRLLSTKVIFMACQTVFTLLTLLPVPLMFWSWWFHVANLVGILLWVLWLGSVYYFEIWAYKYASSVPSRLYVPKAAASDGAVSEGPSAPSTPVLSKALASEGEQDVDGTLLTPFPEAVQLEHALLPSESSDSDDEREEPVRSQPHRAATEPATGSDGGQAVDTPVKDPAQAGPSSAPGYPTARRGARSRPSRRVEE